MPKVVGEVLRALEAPRRDRLEVLAGCAPARRWRRTRAMPPGARIPQRSVGGVTRVRRAGSRQRQGRRRPVIGVRRSQRTRHPSGGVGGAGEGTASASVNGCSEPSTRVSSGCPSRTVLGNAPLGDGTDDRAHQQGLTGADQHEVAEPAPLPDVDLGDGCGVRQVRARGRAWTRAAWRWSGSWAICITRTPPRPQHPRHVGEPLRADEVGRHLALGIRIDDDCVGARVLEGGHPFATALRTHPDAVPAGQRELTAHFLREGGVGFEDDLR